MTKSVCIATYNGVKYIKKQIDSILPQLDIHDEIIIVDDTSSDNTIFVLDSYHDERIKIYRNEENLGHVMSFAKAISLATKDFIYLSDQDDIWVENRINIFEHYFQENPNIQLITSNFHCIDDNDRKILNPIKRIEEKSSFLYNQNILNIFKGEMSYFGCAMAFRRSLINVLLPIPNYINSHDIWLGIIGNILKSNLHINEETLFHRLHLNNMTNPNRKLYKKILTRIDFFKALIEIKKRKWNNI